MIRDLLHTTNPYDNFDYQSYPLDEQHFGSDDINFATIIKKYTPQLVIEVGSWKGGSAIQMSKLLKKHKIDAEIICVDTWLGALEFWCNKDSQGGWWTKLPVPYDPTIFREESSHYPSLKLINGYPSVYYTFLANVMHNNHQDIITPFPITSLIAARWFKAHGILADAIYIDGSHDEQDVILDLQNYWPLVKRGGVLFGDDYRIPDVAKAVDRFTQNHGLYLKTPHPNSAHWTLHKK